MELTESSYPEDRETHEENGHIWVYSSSLYGWVCSGCKWEVDNDDTLNKPNPALSQEDVFPGVTTPVSCRDAMNFLAVHRVQSS